LKIELAGTKNSHYDDALQPHSYRSETSR